MKSIEGSGIPWNEYCTVHLNQVFVKCVVQWITDWWSRGIWLGGVWDSFIRVQGNMLAVNWRICCALSGCADASVSCGPLQGYVRLSGTRLRSHIKYNKFSNSHRVKRSVHIISFSPWCSMWMMSEWYLNANESQKGRKMKKIKKWNAYEYFGAKCLYYH